MRRRGTEGFTVIEIGIVVAIIGLLALLAVPSITKARRKAQATRVANDLRVFGDAFQQYCIDNGRYPPDCGLEPPWNLPNDKMGEYVKKPMWITTTPIGGNYEWKGPSWGEGGPYSYAGIALSGTTANDVTLREVDKALDDGNLLTGKFKRMPNDRCTYVLEER
jgi:type II secretory pathway pseudopilin PulG